MTKELYEAAKDLIDFTKEKYEIKTHDDFYCDKMKRLAIEVDELSNNSVLHNIIESHSKSIKYLQEQVDELKQNIGEYEGC